MKLTLLKNGQIVSDTNVTKADVLIGVTGDIMEIKTDIKNKDAEIVDVKDKLLFPLLIDCHVHFREPGLEHKATILTEAASAIAGGIGCVCEMPNTLPPTVTVAAFADKVRRATEVDGCTLKFFFGVTEAIHLQALRDLWSGSSMEMKKLKHHCSGVKLYLDHSTGNQKIDGSIVEDVFKACAELKIPIIAHCEDPDMNAEAASRYPLPATRDIEAHSKMRPPESEAKSIAEAIALAKKTGAALHIAHLSTKQGIDLVRQAKKEKLPITCEVAPHHLYFTTDDYKALGARIKMNPPIRSAEHRDALWKGIADGTVDCIATDHAPHTIEEKSNENPLAAPSGVPGVETMLPLLLSTVAKKSPIALTYEDIVRLCHTNPNRIFGLHQPIIEEGARARIAVVDPKAQWTVDAKKLHSKCGWTPFEGWKMTGAVTRTIAL
jgi:dihydroorotase